jgi:hypothetical protein
MKLCRLCSQMLRNLTSTVACYRCHTTPYMKKAVDELSVRCPTLTHVTYIVHALHKVCQTIYVP